MKEERGTLWEWLVGSLFIFCGGWLCWHASAFILDFAELSKSRFDQISSMHGRKDVTPDLPGLFGGFADIIDWTCLIGLPILLILGALTVRRSNMEFPYWRPVDRIAVYLGRVAMLLVICMTVVMLTEVFLRYIFDTPTNWANETTLWIGMFVFMLAGVYAMQQRNHIRIVLLYDVMPRSVQRIVDVIWVMLLSICVFLACYFSYVTFFERKFLRWEVLDSAFNPPIPAIMMPVIWVILVLVTLQAILNVISDWNLTAEQIAGTEKAAEEAELEALRKAAQADTPDQANTRERSA